MIAAALLLAASAQGALVTAPKYGARAVQPRMYAAFAKEPVAALGPDGQPSFVQTEMRGAAMALHTKDQSREGKQPAQKPVNAWDPGQADYLQFLVDSHHVYATLEELVTKYDALAQYRNSGLERAGPLEKDIAWFKEQGFAEPPVGAQGTAYAALLRELAAAGNVPYHWQMFTCHFYNFYFAHTAGGRMIGKMMSDKLLDGHKLEFYQWSAGDVDKELLPGLRNKIDEQAATWTLEQKAACLKETANTFRYGGSLLQHISRRG